MSEPLEIIGPDDGSYDQIRAVHNGLIDKRPARIVRPRTTAQVAAAVTSALGDGLEISVRGGGHNVAGKAVTDGGLMIDLSLMKRVDVNPAARTARAEPGVLWGEYNEATAVHGLATTGGVVSTTGLAGLTVGGGLGWLMGKYGLAVDNLLSAEVVTATGEVLRARADENEDLFWAIRGGGGNFGIVTSFEFRTYPLENVLGGLLVHPFAEASAVADLYRRAIKGASDEFRVDFGLVHGPDGSKAAGLPVCHCGDPGQAEDDVAVLRELPPVQDLVSRIPYPVMNTLLDTMFPRGALNYWKTAFFTELSDAAVQTMIDAFAEAPSPMSALVTETFHGQATRIPATATAVPHRDPGVNFLLVAQWTDPAETEANIAWARETFDALRPYMADRRYVNYMSADDAAFIRQAYGPNYDRLVEIKRRYDPDNVFHLNQNIEP